MATVSYTRMADMTAADLALVNADADEDAGKLPDRLMRAVADLERSRARCGSAAWSIRCSRPPRAVRAGKDKEYVAAALVHDIGDALAPYSHGEMVAGVLRPFVSERVCWIIQKHALFQSYYYAHLDGGDRNARDKYRDHPFYDDCVEFCEHFDQNCFDPDYDSLPLEHFRPIVERGLQHSPARGGRAGRPVGPSVATSRTRFPGELAAGRQLPQARQGRRAGVADGEACSASSPTAAASRRRSTVTVEWMPSRRSATRRSRPRRSRARPSSCRAWRPGRRPAAARQSGRRRSRARRRSPSRRLRRRSARRGGQRADPDGHEDRGRRRPARRPRRTASRSRR